MGIVGPIKDRINEKRKEIAKIEGEEKEEVLEHYVRWFVKQHLKKSLKNGDLKEGEEEVETFLQKLENGNFSGHTRKGHPRKPNKLVLTRKGSHVVEEEEMIVKELIFDYLEEYVMEYIESKDKEIVQDVETTQSNGLPKGSSIGYNIIPLTGHDMEYIEEDRRLTNGTPKPQQGKWKYVKEVSLKEHAEEYNFASNALRLLGKMTEDLNLPEDEHRITQFYIGIVEERSDKLNKSVGMLENGNKDGPGKLYFEVAEEIREEELEG